MWVPYLSPFPENEAHNFSGGPKWGVLGGGQRVYVEKVYVLLLSPKKSRVASSFGTKGPKLRSQILQKAPNSGKKRAHKLEKNPWDTGQLSLEARTKKPAGVLGVSTKRAFLAGEGGWVSQDSII